MSELEPYIEPEVELVEALEDARRVVRRISTALALLTDAHRTAHPPTQPADDLPQRCEQHPPAA